MARNDVSAGQRKTIPRILLSVVYLCLVTLLPIAVVLSIIHDQWFALFVSVVAAAVQVPLAIAITRQSGPAMKLTYPIVVVTVLGVLLIGWALG